MTPRVWVERPIATVEDAEALPATAIAICPGDYMAAMTESYTRDGRKIWALTGQDEATVSSRGVIGWTALVPVEATVEELPIGRRPGRRLVTEWEPS